MNPQNSALTGVLPILRYMMSFFHSRKDYIVEFGLLSRSEQKNIGNEPLANIFQVS